MTHCVGRGALDGSHCCVMANEVCPHLVTDVAGRRFACGLLVELGSWDAVEADPRYRPIAEFFGNPRMCRQWEPKPGQCCREEVTSGDVGS